MSVQTTQTRRKLYRKIRDKIKTNPKLHEQDEVCVILTHEELDNMYDSDGDYISPESVKYLKLKNYSCKTPACLYGHIVYEAVHNFPSLSKDIADDTYINEAAEKITGLNENFIELTYEPDFLENDKNGNISKKLQTQRYINILDQLASGKTEHEILVGILQDKTVNIEDHKRAADTLVKVLDQ